MFICSILKLCGKCNLYETTPVAKEPEFDDLLHVGIRPEMRERLDRFKRDKCSNFFRVPTSEIVRYLLDASLTRHGYPSPQAQAQPQAQPFPQMQSPFQAPMGVAANGR
jgi:hypothetical protein